MILIDRKKKCRNEILFTKNCIQNADQWIRLVLK